MRQDYALKQVTGEQVMQRDGQLLSKSRDAHAKRRRAFCRRHAKHGVRDAIGG